MSEEPINAGCFSYVSPRLRTAMRETKHHVNKDLYYSGRAPSCSVATGSKKKHYEEIATFLDEAFDLSKNQHSQSKVSSALSFSFA